MSGGFESRNITQGSWCVYVHIYLDENILWFHISVENAVPVHMVDGLAQLVHVELDPLFWQVGLAVYSSAYQMHLINQCGQDESLTRQ